MDEAERKRLLLNNSIYIRMVDERGTYRTDKHLPNAIFLATVLRWNITSSYVSGVGPGLINPPDNTAFRVRLDDEGGSEVNQVNPATIRADNTRTVVSAAMLLADLIESHEVAVFGAFTKLAIGKEESSRLVHRLRHSDEEAFWDWLDRDGCAYYIKGHELYQALRSRTLAATEGNRCPTDGRMLGTLWFKLSPFPNAAAIEQTHESGVSAQVPAARWQEQTAPEPKKDRKSTDYATTKQIAEAFPMPKDRTDDNWAKTLSDPPNWLKDARVSAGKRGVSALWNPAQFAVCMVSKRHISKGSAGTIIRREFPQWLGEWERSADYLP